MTRPGWLAVALTLVVVVFGLPSFAAFYTDWLWYRELGYDHVFLKSLSTEGTVFAATFFAVWGFLALNLRVAAATIRQPHIVLGSSPQGRPVVVQGRTLSRWVPLGAAAVAVIFATSAATDNWLSWLSFVHAVPFGKTDPIFGREMAFYVFKLPIYQSLRDQAIGLALLALIASGIVYVLSGSFLIEPRYGVAFWPKARLVPAARRHLGLLGALVFGLLAWGAWLDRFRLLLSQTTTNVVYGAGYTDYHARLPFLWIAIVVLAVGCVLSIAYGFGRRAWPIVVAVAAYFSVTLVSGIYASIVQNFSVSPNEQNKELPFIQNNIAATRAAYALDRVDERALTGDATLTPSDIVHNAETIENVRLWDHQPLLQTFSQIQEIRTYYDFAAVDNDRYNINGRYRQVMLSARELNTDNLQSPSWVKKHLTYTHGYGLTLGPVNQVTTEGLPVLFIRDLPPVSTVNMPVEEPGIYFGELSNDYVLVKSRTPEFDYPRGSDNVLTEYHGTGGVPIGNLWRRFLFAMRFYSTDILVTDQITPATRIIYNRQIVQRVQTLAPFLTFDKDPYPVVNGGRIYWIQDAYTTTDDYPYSTPTSTDDNAFNYVRNSVKVVTDAYNGTTRFYLSEPKDPLALTINAIFPGMLRPMDEMPPGLRQHVRYPEDIFRWQANMFATFHMTNPVSFYNKEDQWQIPSLGEADRNAAARVMQPYYMIMRLPGERRTEFVQILPFTPRLKNNLSAWMVARSDAEHYGHMLVYEFPKVKVVYGPQQMVANINQDPVISPQITLWGQQGSEVSWGTLLVLPVEESLLYIRPLYLRSEKGIPELKRVVVAYYDQRATQTRIEMAETLKLALMQVFGSEIGAALPADRFDNSATSVQAVAAAEPTAATAAAASTGDPAAEAQAIMERMDKALRDGDLAQFGEEYKKLREIVAKMKAKKN